MQRSGLQITTFGTVPISPSCWPLGRSFYPRIEPDFHLLVQLFWLPRRLSLCFPASLETNQRKHQGLALLRSVGKWQDLAGLALKKQENFASGCSRSDANAVGRPVVSRLRRPYASPGRSPKSAFSRDPRPSSRRPVSGPPPAWRDWHCRATSTCDAASMSTCLLALSPKRAEWFCQIS